MRTDVKVGIVAVFVVVVLVIVYFSVGHHHQKAASEMGFSSPPQSTMPTGNVPTPPSGPQVASTPTAPIGNGVITPPIAPTSTTTTQPETGETGAIVFNGGSASPQAVVPPPAGELTTGTTNASGSTTNVTGITSQSPNAVVPETPTLPNGESTSSASNVAPVAPVHVARRHSHTSSRYVMRKSSEGYYYVALRADSEPTTANSMPTSSPVHAPRGTYVVRRGDTLASISHRYYGSARMVRAIERLNPGLNPRRLRVGQRIRLPGGSRHSLGDLAPSTSAHSSSPAGTRTYVVRRGDDLRKIAVKYYHKASAWKIIYRANRRIIGANSSNLRAGERLVIPVE